MKRSRIIVIVGSLALLAIGLVGFAPTATAMCAPGVDTAPAPGHWADASACAGAARGGATGHDTDGDPGAEAVVGAWACDGDTTMCVGTGANGVDYRGGNPGTVCVWAQSAPTCEGWELYGCPEAGDSTLYTANYYGSVRPGSGTWAWGAACLGSTVAGGTLYDTDGDGRPEPVGGARVCRAGTGQCYANTGPVGVDPGQTSYDVDVSTNSAGTSGSTCVWAQTATCASVVPPLHAGTGGVDPFVGGPARRSECVGTVNLCAFVDPSQSGLWAWPWADSAIGAGGGAAGGLGSCVGTWDASSNDTVCAGVGGPNGSVSYLAGTGEVYGSARPAACATYGHNGAYTDQCLYLTLWQLWVGPDGAGDDVSAAVGASVCADGPVGACADSPEVRWDY